MTQAVWYHVKIIELKLLRDDNVHLLMLMLNLYKYSTTLSVADYVDKLLTLLFTDVVNNTAEYQQLVDEVDLPPSLCSSFIRPDRAQAVANVVSRFSLNEAAENPGTHPTGMQS